MTRRKWFWAFKASWGNLQFKSQRAHASQTEPQEIHYLKKDLSPKIETHEKAHCVHSICGCFDAMRVKLHHDILDPIWFLAPGMTPSQGKDLALFLKQVIVLQKACQIPHLPLLTRLLGSSGFNAMFSIKGFSSLPEGHWDFFPPSLLQIYMGEKAIIL